MYNSVNTASFQWGQSPCQWTGDNLSLHGIQRRKTVCWRWRSWVRNMLWCQLLWQLQPSSRSHPPQWQPCATPVIYSRQKVHHLQQEVNTYVVTAWWIGKLTSDTLMSLSLLSLVRFAEWLKILAMPMSGSRLCREYDCSILNLGMLTSSLL